MAPSTCSSSRTQPVTPLAMTVLKPTAARSPSVAMAPEPRSAARQSSIARECSVTRSKPPLWTRRSAPLAQSNSRHLSEVEPRLATRIFMECWSVGVLECWLWRLLLHYSNTPSLHWVSLQPLAEHRETVVRTRDHLHADDAAHLGSRRCAGVGGGLDTRDVAAEKRRHVAGTDFFPAGEADVRGLERGVGRFKQSAQPFGFDHSNCLLSHRCVVG